MALALRMPPAMAPGKFFLSGGWAGRLAFRERLSTCRFFKCQKIWLRTPTPPIFPVILSSIKFHSHITFSQNILRFVWYFALF